MSRTETGWETGQLVWALHPETTERLKASIYDNRKCWASRWGFMVKFENGDILHVHQYLIQRRNKPRVNI